MTVPPSTWVLLGEKTGDNNQLLALAEKLGWPFETRTLHYNLVRAIPPRHLGATLGSLTTESRTLIAPPWPDLLLSIGRRSVPVVRWIRERSEGRTKLVLVGHPRVDPDEFDLVITTRQYPVPPRDNVIVLPLAMGRQVDAGDASEDERRLLHSLPRPHLLFAIGGPTKYWDLDEASIGVALDAAVARAERRGGTLIVIGSRRTPDDVIERVRLRLDGGHHLLVEGSSPRFPLLMGDADELFVTADSVSMLSEAIQTGKPVAMVPISLSPKGKKVLGGNNEEVHGWGYGRRDLRRIWKQLLDDGLVGTIDSPRVGQVDRDSAEIGAAAVRGLMARDG